MLAPMMAMPLPHSRPKMISKIPLLAVFVAALHGAHAAAGFPAPLAAGPATAGPEDAGPDAAGLPLNKWNSKWFLSSNDNPLTHMPRWCCTTRHFY